MLDADDRGMSRAYVYLLASAIVWFVEGFLFAHYLQLLPWQVVLLMIMYAALFATATRYFVRSLREYRSDESELSPWRAVSVAPMIVVIVGSFVSLPLILIVLALGKL